MSATETYYFVLHCNGAGCGAVFAGRKNEPLGQVHRRSGTLGWTQVKSPTGRTKLAEHYCLRCQESGQVPVSA